MVITKSMSTHLHKTNGFTLIEVLVALTIFTIAAVAASSASISYIKSTDQLRTKTLAHFVAKNRMADILINNEFSNQNQTSRKANEYGRTWTITQINQVIEPNSIQQITLKISSVNDATSQNSPVTEYVFYNTKSSRTNTTAPNVPGYVFQ